MYKEFHGLLLSPKSCVLSAGTRLPAIVPEVVIEPETVMFVKVALSRGTILPEAESNTRISLFLSLLVSIP